MCSSDLYSHIGKGASEHEVFEGESTATLTVMLSEASPLSTNKVISRFVEATKEIEGLELTFKQEDYSLGSLFGDEEAPIVVEVKGEESEEIAALTDEVMARMASVKDSIHDK